MTIKHTITKRIEKGKRRVFFELKTQKKGDILVTCSFFKLYDLFYFKGKKASPSTSFFYVDVPTYIWKLTTHFDFIFDDGKILAGSFKPSDKYEDLL